MSSWNRLKCIPEASSLAGRRGAVFLQHARCQVTPRGAVHARLGTERRAPRQARGRPQARALSAARELHPRPVHGHDDPGFRMTLPVPRGAWWT